MGCADSRGSASFLPFAAIVGLKGSAAWSSGPRGGVLQKRRHEMISDFRYTNSLYPELGKGHRNLNGLLPQLWAIDADTRLCQIRKPFPDPVAPVACPASNLIGRSQGTWGQEELSRSRARRIRMWMFQCSLRPDPAAAGNQTLHCNLEGIGMADQRGEALSRVPQIEFG